MPLSGIRINFIYKSSAPNQVFILGEIKEYMKKISFSFTIPPRSAPLHCTCRIVDVVDAMNYFFTLFNRKIPEKLLLSNDCHMSIGCKLIHPTCKLIFVLNAFEIHERKLFRLIFGLRNQVKLTKFLGDILFHFRSFFFRSVVPSSMKWGFNTSSRLRMFGYCVMTIKVLQVLLPRDYVDVLVNAEKKWFDIGPFLVFEEKWKKT